MEIQAVGPARHDVTLLADQDFFLFNEGTHYRMYNKMGAHLSTAPDGTPGACFSVWAPNAREVYLTGSFNGWNERSHPLHQRGFSGIWECFVSGIGVRTLYKFHIVSSTGYSVNKADPIGFLAETPPHTASVVWDLDYTWNDSEWMTKRSARNSLHAPMSIYEVHFGSWMRVPEEGNRSLTYREMASRLAEYARRMHFTHVEFLPIMEHPFYASWGYQSTGYFAPTSRYGTPQDLMFLIDYLHQNGIGVILDWVPSHFPTDEHSLAFFDGTHLYEHSDIRQGFHPDWKTYIFNYGRNEIRSFLMSSGMFWLDRYHADGLRLDAVASMLYLDYSRKHNEWIPNKYGGRENIEAVDFLRRFNQEAYEEHPDIQTIAEESTAWPQVSRPTSSGGLGFGMKWDMGWMHDTLKYFARDPIYRKFDHNLLTFRGLYSFTENFVLPLSHDEVVHGKGSLLNKMPGDQWQQFANLRLLFAYMYAQPGKKMIFMGGEFGQRREWNHDSSLDWNLLEHPLHRGLQNFVEQLNRVYAREPGLHWFDNEPAGFEWLDCENASDSIVALLRHGQSPADDILIVCNFTPVPRLGYRLGVDDAGFWEEILNSDAKEYGGGNVGNMGGCAAMAESSQGRPFTLRLSVPPLGALFFKRKAPEPGIVDALPAE